MSSIWRRFFLCSPTNVFYIIIRKIYKKANIWSLALYRKNTQSSLHGSASGRKRYLEPREYFRSTKYTYLPVLAIANAVFLSNKSFFPEILV